jgi:hypothetical protein
MEIERAIIGASKHHSIIDMVTIESLLRVSFQNEGRDINTGFNCA